MREISSQEVREQARRYAYQMVAWLQQHNAEAPSHRAPLVEPENLTRGFERLYARFVAQWYVVRP
jgi:hypothetical protein